MKVDLYNIPFGTVERYGLNFFDKEKYVLHYENLHLFLRLGLKLKKIPLDGTHLVAVRGLIH